MLALLRTPGLEETSGVQFIVPMKFPDRTVKLIAAGLGDHADLGAGVVSILSGERGGLDADFLDRVRRRRIEPGRLRKIREVGAVQREIVLSPGRAVHDHGGTATGAPHLLGVAHVRSTWTRTRQLRHLSAIS